MILYAIKQTNLKLIISKYEQDFMKKILFVLLTICCAQVITAQNQTDQFNSLLNYMYNKYYFNGVVLAADTKNIIYEKAFGFANKDWNIVNTAETQFRLGSVSKQFIGFILITLADEQKWET